MNFIKRFCFCLIIVTGGLLTHPANAQQYVSDRPTPDPQAIEPGIVEVAPPFDPNKPLRYVEQMPMFKGDLPAYVTKHLKYPAEVDLPDGKGRTFVQFVVTKSGLIRDIEIIRKSGCPKCDLEAVRVLQPMTTKIMWKAGRLHGKNVDVFYTIPVIFDHK